VGRHSGAAALKHVLNQAGISLTAGKTEKLLVAVRAEANKKQSVLSPDELVRLYRKTQ
jgi:hypothetical protein